MFKGMKIYAIMFTLIAILIDTIQYGEIDFDYAIETAGTMVFVSIPIFVLTWIAVKIYENRNQIMKLIFKKEKEES